MNKGLNINNVKFTEHFRRTCETKGFTSQQIISALTKPEKVTDVRRFPGQLRYCGAGIAIVMEGNTAITAYLDGVVTPIRPDQLNDPEALNSKRLAGRR